MHPPYGHSLDDWTKVCYHTYKCPPRANKTYFTLTEVLYYSPAAHSTKIRRVSDLSLGAAGGNYYETV